MPNDSEKFEHNRDTNDGEDRPTTEASPPGYVKLRGYFDESGIHGAKYVGIGSLWMPHERRGDFVGLFEQIKRSHGITHELKWSKISSFNERFVHDVVCAFFRTRYLMFHCLVMRKDYIDLAHHETKEHSTRSSRDLALRKHFTMLATTKMKFFADGEPKEFFLVVDPLPSSYAKADEAAEVIIGHTLKRDVGKHAIIRSLTTRDSKDTPGIQLADVLLGATLADWQGEVSSGPKTRIAKLVAMHLGWPDTQADTYPGESKFNIWHFHDPIAGHAREVRTRGLRLTHPMTPFVRRSRR